MPNRDSSIEPESWANQIVGHTHEDQEYYPHQVQTSEWTAADPAAATQPEPFWRPNGDESIQNHWLDQTVKASPIAPETAGFYAFETSRGATSYMSQLYDRPTDSGNPQEPAPIDTSGEEYVPARQGLGYSATFTLTGTGLSNNPYHTSYTQVDLAPDARDPALADPGQGNADQPTAQYIYTPQDLRSSVSNTLVESAKESTVSNWNNLSEKTQIDIACVPAVIAAIKKLHSNNEANAYWFDLQRLVFDSPDNYTDADSGAIVAPDNDHSRTGGEGREIYFVDKYAERKMKKNDVYWKGLIDDEGLGLAVRESTVEAYAAACTAAAAEVCAQVEKELRQRGFAQEAAAHLGAGRVRHKGRGNHGEGSGSAPSDSSLAHQQQGKRRRHRG